MTLVRCEGAMRSQNRSTRSIPDMTASTSFETAAVARVSAPAHAAAEGEYLSFRLGTEEYGIDILRVQEIRGFEQPTRLAGAPESMCGVLNLAGGHRTHRRPSDPLRDPRVPAFNGTIDAGHITGIATLRQGESDRMLILVDIEQLVVKTHVGLIH